MKKSFLWHRLLFRAADSLAREKLVSRPTKTVKLTNKKEWMLTEAGYNRILEMLNIPLNQKDSMHIKSYEVQRIVKKINEQKRLENYNPFDNKRISVNVTLKAKLRKRAFRQAVIESYEFKCAVCGMKIYAPNSLKWEVEAAHIVPYASNGKDDIINGLALCRLHHWAFDVGWFTLDESYNILASRKIRDLSDDLGKMGSYDIIGQLLKAKMILLPKDNKTFPHPNAIKWHRENIFYR